MSRKVLFYAHRYTQLENILIYYRKNSIEITFYHGIKSKHQKFGNPFIDHYTYKVYKHDNQNLEI